MSAVMVVPVPSLEITLVGDGGAGEFAEDAPGASPGGDAGHAEDDRAGRATRDGGGIMDGGRTGTVD